MVIEQETCHWGLEKPSLAYGFVSIFFKLLYKGVGEMDWDFEDTHLEIKNTKNQEDYQGQFHIAKKENKKDETVTKHPLPLR